MVEDERSLEKEKIIQKTKRRLTAIFQKKEGESPETVKLKRKKKESVESLIEEAAFMAGSLYELRRIIEEKGYVEEYQNGQNQKGFKKTCEVEIYNTMIKNYMSCVKQLTDMLPKEAAKQAEISDGFEEFIESK